MILNKSISHQSVINDISTDIHNLFDSTVDNFHIKNDLLQNRTFIILLGVFVLFFSVFVIAYIFFKCFQTKTNSSKTKETVLQAQYQALNPVEPESTVYTVQHRRSNVDSAYLSPVFSCNERSDTLGLQENDLRLENNEVLQENTVGGVRLRHDLTTTENELNDFRLNDQTDHVYIEITDASLPFSNLAVDY